MLLMNINVNLSDYGDKLKFELVQAVKELRVTKVSDVISMTLFCDDVKVMIRVPQAERTLWGLCQVWLFATAISCALDR